MDLPSLIAVFQKFIKTVELPPTSQSARTLNFKQTCIDLARAHACLSGIANALSRPARDAFF